jgi:hypothetical protein
MGVRALLRAIFADVPLMRQVLRQWKENSDGMHSSLYELYSVMYMVVFETPMCFAVMSERIMTHQFNGFEIEFALMSPAQKALLSEILEAGEYSVTNCQFVKNVSMTNIKDDEPGAPWCDTNTLFSLFVEEELVTADCLATFAVRTDTFAVMLQDMFNRGTMDNEAHFNYLARLLEMLQTQLRVRSANPGGGPLEENAFVLAMTV